MADMRLIMVDECGDEVEVAQYNIGDGLDDDYMELWKDKKISDAHEQYPEARGFYFEDRGTWNSMIHAMICDDDGYDPWEDEEVEE